MCSLASIFGCVMLLVLFVDLVIVVFCCVQDFSSFNFLISLLWSLRLFLPLFYVSLILSYAVTRVLSLVVLERARPGFRYVLSLNSHGRSPIPARLGAMSSAGHELSRVLMSTATELCFFASLDSA